MSHNLESPVPDMTAILERDRHMMLDGPHKSLPAGFLGSSADIAGLGWSVTRDVPLPNLVLDREALVANVTLFQSYADEHGAVLAPHAKATMSPQIWFEQLAAGAWGLTVATVSQLEVCVAFGIPRVLIANEVVDAYSAGRLVELVAQHDWLSITCLVDSEAAAERLQRAMAASGTSRRLDVLVEFGMPGGRTGVRTIDDLLTLCESVQSEPALRLVGVEGYEGILGVARDEKTLGAVDSYLASWAEAIRAVLPLVEPGAPRLASAGGSIYFDRVVAAFAPLAGECTLVLRSGCYATHDSVMFDAASPLGASVPAGQPRLTPALRVYAAVLSRPEPGVVIAGARGARPPALGGASHRPRRPRS